MGSRVKRRPVSVAFVTIVAILLATALLLVSVSPLSSVHAVTQESPSPYADANMDTNVNVLDLSYVKKITVSDPDFPPTSASDANVDGRINVLDLSYVKKITVSDPDFPVITRYEATYDLSVSGEARTRNIAALPPTLTDNFDTDPTGWTEPNPAQYTSISAEDGDAWAIEGSSGAYTALQCRFPIDEVPANITSIDIYFNGSSETAGNGLQLWVWKTTGEWTQVGSGNFSMTTAAAAYSANTFQTSLSFGKVFANYIQGGYMYILATHNVTDKDLSVDYIKLVISTPTPMALPDTTPPAAVTDLACSNSTGTSINLTWTAPGDDGDVGTATEYDIRYSSSIIGSDAKFNASDVCTLASPITPSAPGSTETVTVTGLYPETTYYFALKTADEVPNWSALSNSPSGTTLTRGPNTVYFNQSVYTAAPAANFTARVMISDVTDGLYGGGFDLTYNYSVITVSDPTNGQIDGSTVSMLGNWNLVGGGPGGQGTLRVAIDLTGYVDGAGNSTVTGSGYICDMHFNVIGSTGVTSPLEFTGSLELTTLELWVPVPLDATWQNSSVSVGTLLDLTINSTTGGTVTTPGEGTFPYPEGEVVDLVATPDAGYLFVNWTPDTGTIADVNASTTTITMNASYSITANFQLETITYNLTVGSTAGGSVTTPGEDTYTYPKGTVVNLTATPDTCYQFVNWTGDVSEIADVNASTTNITMNATYSITANFALISYDLTINSTAGGNVTTPAEGTFPYDCGTVVNLTATPDTCYEFVNWTGDIGSIANASASTTNITMNGTYSITANFAALGPYDLTVNSTDGGNVTTPAEGTHSYGCGEVVDINATADSGYVFVEWTGNISRIDDAHAANTTITMLGNYSITANFVSGTITYNLTVNSTDGGNVTTPTEGTHSYNVSQVVNINATADSGYVFVEWTPDTGTIADVSAANTTIQMLANYSITANFVVAYNLTTASTTGGSVTTPGEGTFSYAAGTAVDLVAVHDTGYNFVNWTGQVSEIADVNASTTTITMNGTYSITANFAGITYDLTINSTAGGSVTTPGEGTFPCGEGEVVNLAATADGCHVFVNWSGDIGTIADPNASATPITMNDNYSITANFEIITYNLTTASTTGGSVTNPGEGSFTRNCSEVVPLVATADADYAFVNWTGDTGTIANPDASSTSIFMNGNYSITANFAVAYTLTVNSTAGGSVTTPGEGTLPYPPGTAVDLVATPDDYYSFVNWTGDVSEIANASAASTNITMNASYNITANFESTFVGTTVYFNQSLYTAAPATNFTARVMISDVTDGLYGGGFDLTYNYSVITVSDPTDGQIDGFTVPMLGNWNLVGGGPGGQGTLRVAIDLTGYVDGAGNSTVTGSGSICDIHFNVIGSTDDTSPLEFTGSLELTTLKLWVPVPLDPTWVNSSVSVATLLDLTVNSTAGGTVTTPGEGTFPYPGGQVVSLVATPDSDYVFVNWTGDVSEIADVNASTTTITMNASYSITANFALISYDLTINSSDGGNVTTPGEGTYTCNSSEVVNLLATPDPDYAFINWTGDIGTIANPDASSTTIFMNGNYNITANFAITYDLTINSSDGGSVTTPGEGTFPCAEGAVVDLVATPDACYQFVNWTGEVGTIANPNASTTTIFMNASYNITANFEIITYYLTTNSTAGGNVSPNVTDEPYNCGSQVNLVATADPDYGFVNWTGDPVDGITSPNVNITMLGNYSITANFAAGYDLNVTSDGCCPIEVSGGVTGTVAAGATETFSDIAEGTEVTLTANDSDPCCQFVEWTQDGIGAGTNKTLVVLMDSDHTANATCSVITYNLTIAVSGNGSTTPAVGNHTYDCGTVVNISATPNSGWKFINWSGEVGTVANASAANTTITMNANYSITANFAAVYDLTVTSDGCCTIEVSGLGTVAAGATETFSDIPAGTDVTLTANDSDPCCQFVEWTVGFITLYTKTIVVTMDSDVTAVATCSLIPYDLTIAVSGNGSTTPAGTSTHDCGTVVNISATPGTGYKFVNWSGPDADKIANASAANTTIQMFANYSITANFIAIYDLTVTSVGCCLIDVSGGVTGTVAAGATETFIDITYGTEVTLTANDSDPCCQFVEWTQDGIGAGTNKTLVVLMDSDHTANATCSVITYNLTIAISGNGSTTPAEGTHTYNCSDVVNINATADSDYVFVNWSGEIDKIADPDAANTTIQMLANYSITANFAGIRNLTINSSDGGNVTQPGEGTFPYGEGAVVDLVAERDTGYVFVKWTGDNGTIADVNAANTTIQMLANYSITANFTIGYVLTVTSSGCCPIDVGGLGTVAAGATESFDILPGSKVTLTANVSDPCCVFDKWKVDGITVKANPITVTVNSDLTAVATCYVPTYDLTVNASPAEGGSVNGSGTYDCGTNATINATPAEPCWYFVNWTGTGIADPASPSTTVHIDGDKTVTANFAKIQYQLTVNASPAEGGNVTGGGTYDCCTNASINATPADACWYFVNWTGDVADPDSPSTTVHIDGNKSVTANFARYTYTLTVNASPAEGGSVNGSGTYDCCTDASINATPAGACWYFVNWTGDVAEPDSASTTVHIDGNKTVTANFARYTYTLTTSASPSEGGSVTGGGTHDCCTNPTVTAIPADACWYFTGWSGDLSGSVNPTTIHMDSNKSVTASFAKYTYNLVVSSTDGGNVTTPGEGTQGPYDCGTVVDLVAVPDTHYAFVNWTGQVSEIANASAATTTITMLATYSIQANFVLVAVPPPAVSDLGCSATDWQTIQLTWTATGEAGGEYDIRYSLAPITDANWDTAQQCTGEPPTAVNGTPESFNVSGLAPNTTYYFRLKATNPGSDWSDLSNETSCTTPIHWCPADITYNYVGVTRASGPHDAYYCDVDQMPPTGGNLNSKTEATDAQYTAISASDDSRWTTPDPGWGDEVFLWLDMIISDDPSIITNIDLTFEGYSNGGAAAFEIWAYNDNTATWGQIGTDGNMPASADGTMTRSITSGFSNYIDGTGLFTWGVYSNDTSDSMQIDYVEAVVSATAPCGDETPPAAVYLTASDPTTSSINLSWIAPGDDDIVGTATAYDIRYSTAGPIDTAGNWSAATECTGEPTPSPAGTPETFNVTGLDDNTLYYFALKSVDDEGLWSNLSNSPSETTVPVDTGPPAAVTDLACSNPTTYSINLTWTAPADDGSDPASGPATEYDIRYSTTGQITEGNWGSATPLTGEPAPGTPGSTETFTVTGLDADRTYYFALKTADEIPNWSGISNSPSAATLADTFAPAAVTNLACSSPALYSIDLTWTAPADDGSDAGSGSATEYDIRYSTSQITDEASWNAATNCTGEPAPGTPGTTDTFTVTGLDMNTTYWFALKTADEVPNWSDLSNSPSATTLTPAPNTVYFNESVYHIAPAANFTARVMISEVTDGLYGGGLDLTYNYSVITVSDLSDGQIDGSIVSMLGNWNLVGAGPGGQGTLRVAIDLTGYVDAAGNSTVTGSGYICDIYLNVIGSANDTSPLEFTGSLELTTLKLWVPVPLEGTWVNSSVSVE